MLARRRAGESAGVGSEQGARIADGAIIRPSCCWPSIGRECCISTPIWPGGRRRRSWPMASSFAASFGPMCSASKSINFKSCSGSEFAAESGRQRLIGIVPWAIENRVNKQTRIRRLGPYLSNRRIKFKSGSPGTRLLVEQLKEFPLADHDDGPDAAGNGDPPGGRMARPPRPRRRLGGSAAVER